MNEFSKSIDLANLIDRKSFILGMMAAFSECVSGECKKAAFSPPFYPDDYFILHNEAQKITEEQGLNIWYEENLDIPENVRVGWFVIYKFTEVLEEYKEIRKQGYNPAFEFDKFREFLSYGIVYGENSNMVKPKMRKKEVIMGTVARILFNPGEWPPKK